MSGLFKMSSVTGSVSTIRENCGLTFIAALGDANDPGTWSGIPYHFLQEARRRGLVQYGLKLSTSGIAWKARRAIWNAKRLLESDRYGGYQFSESFLARLWERDPAWRCGDTVVNCFQLFPSFLLKKHDVQKVFFIDMTLRQLFETYGTGERTGARIQHDAMLREQEGYHSARWIIAHSQWAARSVTADYGIPPEKVVVVVPGASLDAGAYDRWLSSRAQTNRSADPPEYLKLVFVGKYWKRKGLDRLLHAFQLATERGFKATLRIIGIRKTTAPQWAAKIPGVEWTGCIDKSHETSRFLELVADSDLGCMLSRAEAGGIALREFHALGLPVIGPDVGGARDHMIDGASIAVPPAATPEEIAEILFRLGSDRRRLSTMSAVAWNRRAETLWAHSVAQMHDALMSSASRDARDHPKESVQ